MHSTVSQHSRRFASSAFYAVPWKLSFAGPVMYSKLHLQLTDKSTLCCAWRMAVKMEIRHGMLLCQEEGHFRFSPARRGTPLLGVKPNWPFCLSFNIFLSLFRFNEMTGFWIVLFHCCVSQLLRADWKNTMCQLYLLFAERMALHLQSGNCVCVCVVTYMNGAW